MFPETLCSGISNHMYKNDYVTFCSGTGAETIKENDDRYFINPMLEPPVENCNDFKHIFSWLF